MPLYVVLSWMDGGLSVSKFAPLSKVERCTSRDVTNAQTHFEFDRNDNDNQHGLEWLHSCEVSTLRSLGSSIPSQLSYKRSIKLKVSSGILSSN